MRMKGLITTLLLMLCIVARAQNVDALYDEGKKLYDQKKYELAIKKLLPAAEKGHKKAQYRVGRCYDKGHGVTEDNQKAFQWYAKAAAQGHAKSQYQLSRCYLKGKGTTQDQAKAKSWLAKAVGNKKGGDKVAKKMKEDAAKGDKDAKALRQLLNRK